MEIAGPEFDRWLLALCDEEKQIKMANSIVADRRLFPQHLPHSDQSMFTSPIELSYTLGKDKLSQITLLLRSSNPIVCEAVWTILATTVQAPQDPMKRRTTSSDARIRMVVTSKLPEKAVLLADNGFHTGDVGPRRAALLFLAAFSTTDPTALVMGSSRMTPMLIREIAVGTDRVVQGLSMAIVWTLTKYGPLRDFLVGGGMLPELKRLFAENLLPEAKDVAAFGVYGDIVMDATLNALGVLRNVASNVGDDLKAELSSMGFISLLVAIICGTDLRTYESAEIAKAMKTYACLTAVEQKSPEEALSNITTFISNLHKFDLTMQDLTFRAIRNTLVFIPGENILNAHEALRPMVPYLSRRIKQDDLEGASDAFSVLREFSRGPGDEAKPDAKSEKLNPHKKNDGHQKSSSNLSANLPAKKDKRLATLSDTKFIKKNEDPRWTVFQFVFTRIQEVLKTWTQCPASSLTHILGLLCNLSTQDKLAQHLAADPSVMSTLLEIVKDTAHSQADKPTQAELKAVALECIRNLCIDEKACKAFLKIGGDVFLRVLLTSTAGTDNHTVSFAILRNLILQNDSCFTTFVLCNNEVPNNLCSNLISEVVSGLSSMDVHGVQRYSLDILSMTLDRGGEKMRQILLDEGCLEALVVLMDTSVDHFNAEVATRCFRLLRASKEVDEDPWTRIMKEWKRQEMDDTDKDLSTAKGKKKTKKTSMRRQRIMRKRL
ncbi:hypothetical protein HDU97_006678 [Phlyctochytrium planicorne]|nr:hypothetical protein HDU97_006678 [Phlyctochytrium planicorne]